jgi:hypothetical protein
MSRKTSFSDELAGMEPHSRWDRDLAHLASAVYRSNDDQGALPKGWSPVAPDKYPRGLVESVDRARPGDTWLNDDSKFRACIYKHEEGERYAVVFRGTKTQSWSKSESISNFVDSWKKNLAVNIGQSVGLETKQYELAMNVAQRAKAQWGPNVVFAGHSLGGGLAAAAAIYTRNSAVTFNPAGIHDNTFVRASTFKEDALQDARKGAIRAIIVEGDALDNVQKGKMPLINAASRLTFQTLPTAPGNEVRLRHEYISADTGQGKALHSLERTISAMDSDMLRRFTDKDSEHRLLSSLARSQSPNSSELRTKTDAVHDFVRTRPDGHSVGQATMRAVTAMANDDHRVRGFGEKLADHRGAPAFSTRTTVSPISPSDSTQEQVKLVARKALEGKKPSPHH